MKKLIGMVLAVMMSLTLGCTKVEKEASIANPWEEVETIEEAKKNAGFDINVPETVDSKEITYIASITDETIDVRYGDDYVSIRKGKGSEDISGDYNEYTVNEEETIDGMNVVEKGEDDVINNVTWTNGDYSYSIYSQTGITIETVHTLVSSIS